VIDGTMVSDNTTKRIVVVGGKGFIGSSLVSHLEAVKFPTLLISRSEFDLLNKDDCEAISAILLPTDIIVFASAITPARSPKDVIDSMSMLHNFLIAVSGNALDGFVLVSSDAVYGDFDGSVSENSPRNPNTFHGLAQLAREMILDSSHIGRKVILRLCAVYGPGDTHNSYGPNRFISQIINKEPIKVLGSGLNRRDHIYIEDVVRLIVAVAQSGVSGTFNLASGVTYSFRDVAMACKEEFGQRSPIEYVGSEGFITNRIINVNRIRDFSEDSILRPLNLGLKQWKVHQESQIDAREKGN